MGSEEDVHRWDNKRNEIMWELHCQLTTFAREEMKGRTREEGEALMEKDNRRITLYG